MGILDKIKSWFRKGGVHLGMGQELNTILDHPKINIDPDEYTRINENLRIYSNKYKPISYRNSRGQKKERQFVTLNMMKEVAATYATLVFNEQCKITIANTTANDFISGVFKDNGFHKKFSDYLEPTFALGGLCVRPYVDTTDYKIKFSWALPNTFYPLRNNTNDISECALATTTRKTEGKEVVYYTLLEFHEWDNGDYVITNELYRSENKDSVGKQVPLNRLYRDLEGTARIPDLSRSLFCYVKPKGFNNINPQSPLGLSVCDNAKDTLKQINDTYDQFNWEIKMGKRKIAASEHFFNVEVDEAGNAPVQTFDGDSDVFVLLHSDQNEAVIKDLTKDIRSSQYIESINHFFKTLEMQVKLSSGTFTFDGKSVKTATEVVSENSQTFRTRNSQITEVENFIKELIVSVCELASRTIGSDGTALYIGPIPTFDEIGIDFDDGVFQDRAQMLEHYGKAVTFGLIPKVEAIQRVFDIPLEIAVDWQRIIRREALLTDPEARAVQATVGLFGREEIKVPEDGERV